MVMVAEITAFRTACQCYRFMDFLKLWAFWHTLTTLSKPKLSRKQKRVWNTGFGQSCTR